MNIQKQEALLAETLKEMDIVICTAQIPEERHSYFKKICLII